MKTMKNIMAALCCLFALTLWTGCSGDDDGDNNNPKPAATTLYRGSLVLESWIDSTKIAEEMPRIEETFLQYLGVKSLKNFTVSEGDEATNDAAVKHQCALAAAVLAKTEYDGGYKLTILKAESKDTLFVFQPTPSNRPTLDPLDGMAHSVLPEDDYSRPTNYYISDVAVAASESSNGAQVELANRGYSIITTDLNEGLGGDYVYLGIKYSTNVHDAISDLYIMVGTRWGGDFTRDGLTFSPVNHYGNNYGSLNSNTGGKEMWLYATKEGKKCLKQLSVVESEDRMEGDDLVRGIKSDMSLWDNYRGVDINTGAGGKYRYLRNVFSDVTKPSKTAQMDSRAIDMGLSVMWASMNVGAEKVTDFGSFFAWAETKGDSSKDTGDGRSFTPDTYVGNSDNYIVGGTTVLTPDDDAATVNWGGKWRMPTRKEMEELCNTRVSPAYSWEWRHNYGAEGCHGYLITYKANGNAIFLPAVGCRFMDFIIDQGKVGCYWTSSVEELEENEDSDVSLYAHMLIFCEGEPYAEAGYDCFDTGYSIRPVLPVE